MAGIQTGGNRIPIRVLDFLSTHDGTWYTIENVASWLGRSRPAVARAVWRLIEGEHVEYRQIDKAIEIRVSDRAAIDAVIGTAGPGEQATAAGKQVRSELGIQST